MRLETPGECEHAVCIIKGRDAVIAAEFVGIILVAIAFGMFWIVRPVDRVASPFIRRSHLIEVVYSMAILFILVTGLGTMLWGVLA